VGEGDCFVGPYTQAHNRHNIRVLTTRSNLEGMLSSQSGTGAKVTS